MWKKLLNILFFVLVALNIGAGIFWGVSSVLLTFSFYAALLMLVMFVINQLHSENRKAANYKMLFTVLFFTLFVAELGLKYAYKKNLTYSEKNGDFFSFSPYKRIALENLGRKYFFKQHDTQLRLHKPHSIRTIQKAEFTYQHHINSLGLRGNEPDSNRKITWITLGDSFTEGIGTPDDSTWTVLLENNLRQNSTIGSLQCINGGSGGTDPFYAYLLLKRKLLGFKPQVVIVCVNQSDIYEIVERGGMERFREDGTVQYHPGPWWEFFYQLSYIFRAVVHTFSEVNWQLLTSEQVVIENRRALEKLEHCILNEYKKLAEENRFQLVVVLHPLQQELEENNFSLQPLYESIYNDTAFITINLFEEMKAKQDSIQTSYADWYWATDLHNNPIGYQLWANILSEKLNRLTISDEAN